MKNRATAAVLCLALGAGSANAGGFAEPVVPPQVVKQTTTHSHNIWVPLILALVVIAALASSSHTATPVPAPPILE